VLHTKTASLGNATTSYPWSNFTNAQNPVGGISDRLAKIEAMLAPLMPSSGGVAGSWLFWGKTASEIPTGWEAVPDSELGGVFLVGKIDADPEFDLAATPIGERSHSLIYNEMPSHSHNFTGFTTGGGLNSGGDSGHNVVDQNTLSHTLSTSIVGNGLPHNNLPPYKVVMYIRWVGL
jgi:hypothetical protein